MTGGFVFRVVAGKADIGIRGWRWLMMGIIESRTAGVKADTGAGGCR